MTRSVLARCSGIAFALIVLLSPVGCGRATTPPPAAPGSTPAVTVTTAPSSTPVAPAPAPTAGSWQWIAATPVSTAVYSVIWTGSRMLLHRPNTEKGRGSIDAAYDPATNAWRRLPSSPYPVRSIEGGTQAVWDGSELLTFGVMNAALNPATGRWRPLATPPQFGASVVLWTGRRALIWGGGCCDSVTAAGAEYNPVTDRWTALPKAPLAGRWTAGVWTGTEMVIVGGRGPDEGAFFADAAAYNPMTHRWRTLASLPAPRYGATLTWTGREVLVVGGERNYVSAPYADGYAFNPSTGRWRRLPAMESGRTGHTAVWTGRYLIVWGGQTSKPADNPDVPPHGLVLDPAAGRWTPIPKAPITARRSPAGIWTGTAMIVWGGSQPRYPYPEKVDGAIYRP